MTHPWDQQAGDYGAIGGMLEGVTGAATIYALDRRVS